MEICLCNSFPSENPLLLTQWHTENILLVSVQFSIIFFYCVFVSKKPQ